VNCKLPTAEKLLQRRHVGIMPVALHAILSSIMRTWEMQLWQYPQHCDTDGT